MIGISLRRRENREGERDETTTKTAFTKKRRNNETLKNYLANLELPGMCILPYPKYLPIDRILSNLLKGNINCFIDYLYSYTG